MAAMLVARGLMTNKIYINFLRRIFLVPREFLTVNMAAVMKRTHVLILRPIQSRIQSLLASSKKLEDSGLRLLLLLTPLQMPVFDTGKKHKPQFYTCNMNIFNVVIFDLKERYKIVFPKLYH